MAEFWSDEWFVAVNAAADALPPAEGIDFTFDVEVAETANGKVRGHGEVVDGRLASFVTGKFVPPEKGQKPQVTFSGKAKRIMPVLMGQRPALVAYMLGELKVDGEYELVVDKLAGSVDRAALETFRAAVADQTES